MNQQQLITELKAKGYTVALSDNRYSVMTKPVGNEHTGQVIHKDGTILTLKSVDAVRAINNEEINMSTYYTKEQLEAMTEKERTAIYNIATGKTVARMRNKDKAVDEILAAKTVDPVKAAQHNTGTAPLKKGESVLKGDTPEGKAPKIPGRPKEGTVSDTVWTLADAMSKTGNTRAEVVAACVTQGINPATAKTQYQRWSKFNESDKAA